MFKQTVLIFVVGACGQTQLPSSTTTSSTATSPDAETSLKQEAASPAVDISVCAAEVGKGELEMCGTSMKWAPDNESTGTCRTSEEGASLEQYSKAGRGVSWEFSAVLDGPSGSGRYWQIAVMRTDTGGGFCTEESTNGARSLLGSQAAERLFPLTWIADIDSDGFHELILWGSVARSPDDNLSEEALMPTVYRTTANAFVLDKELTQNERMRVASIYRDAAKEGKSQLRKGLAQALEASLLSL